MTRSEMSVRIHAMLQAHPKGLTLAYIQRALWFPSERMARDALSAASLECATSRPVAVLGYVPHLGVYKIATSQDEAQSIIANRAKRIASQGRIIHKQAQVAAEVFNLPEQTMLNLIFEGAS